MEKIFIQDLSVTVRTGVTEEERSKKQNILISVEIEPEAEYETLKDSLENTIDYSSIRKDIKKILERKSFKLIETASAKVARCIKDNYRVKHITVTVKKFPYIDAGCVGYQLTL